VKFENRRQKDLNGRQFQVIKLQTMMIPHLRAVLLDDWKFFA
jgi:hypothetical protein